MNNKTKETLEKEICEIICKIDRQDLLEYLHRLISNIVKAGR